VGERGGDEEAVVAAEAEVLDLHHRRPGEGVVAVENPLRLARGPGGEEQLGERLGGRLAGGDRVAVDRDRVERGGEIVPLDSAVPRQHRRLAVGVGADHQDVLERQLWLGPGAIAFSRQSQHAGRLRQVVAVAEAVGDDQHPRPRPARHLRDLALAEDRHQRAADGADLHRAKRQGDELTPVR
jgi:hypothetical protein